MKSYFAKPASGVNEDLRRHAAKAKKMDQLIQELENQLAEQGELGECDQSFLNAYRTFRRNIEESKANVAANIGKRK